MGYEFLGGTLLNIHEAFIVMYEPADSWIMFDSIVIM